MTHRGTHPGYGWPADYTVDWRFISVRLINADVDYDSHFPAGYEAGHTSGLRLLRVAARARAEHGPGVVGPLYEAFSSEIFDSPQAAELTPQVWGSREFAEPLLARAGLPSGLAEALDETSWDAELQSETDYALSLTGRDVGTPIIQFQPPDGIAFFGPVISRPPGDDDAVGLWDHVSAWPHSPASLNSSAASASARSSAVSASTPDKSEPKKTGTAPADAPQADSPVHLTSQATA